MEQSFFPVAACIQFEVRLGEPQANLEQVFALFGELAPRKQTLIVLPELWGTGFDYPRAVQLAGETPRLLRALQDLAAAGEVYIAGSLLEVAKGETVPGNTLFVVGPNGVLGSYRKQHLFGFWQEDRFFQAGNRPRPVATPHGPLAVLVCYDLRFPELAREQVFAGSRLIVVSAQWPMIRLDHWQALLRSRAIENQAFVVAGNSSGVTGKIEFAGHSMIIGPDGSTLAEAGRAAGVVACELDESQLEELRSRFCTVAERPWLTVDSDKVVSLPQLLSRLEDIRRQGSRIAFTNGCFDLLHSGHVSYLEHARRMGDCLVLGLNSDRSVRTLKGDGRPVNREQDRARLLAALGCVDFVVIFDEETPLKLITSILPDVLVKGADWPEEQIVGAREVKAAGGRVERITFENDRSTSAVIEKIQQRKK